MSGRAITEMSLSDGSNSRIVGRRVLFAVLVTATIATLLALAAYALSAGGFGLALACDLVVASEVLAEYAAVPAELVES